MTPLRVALLLPFPFYSLPHFLFAQQLYVTGVAMLQLPQTRPPILILSRTTERLRQAILLLRQHRTRMPNATPTSLQSKMLHESPHPHPSKINRCSQNCGRFGHTARVCPNDAIEYGAGGSGGFATRTLPPGRDLSLSFVKCYRCGGLNYMAQYARTQHAHAVLCS